MFRRPNPVFSDEYRAIISILIQARSEAGLSQRDLAKRLDKAQSHVSMIERGQRRVDVLEFYKLARALGLDPVSFYARTASGIDAVQPDASGDVAA